MRTSQVGKKTTFRLDYNETGWEDAGWASEEHAALRSLKVRVSKTCLPSGNSPKKPSGKTYILRIGTQTF